MHIILHIDWVCVSIDSIHSPQCKPLASAGEKGLRTHTLIIMTIILYIETSSFFTMFVENFI